MLRRELFIKCLVRLRINQLQCHTSSVLVLTMTHHRHIKLVTLHVSFRISQLHCHMPSCPLPTCTTSASASICTLSSTTQIWHFTRQKHPESCSIGQHKSMSHSRHIIGNLGRCFLQIRWLKQDLVSKQCRKPADHWDRIQSNQNYSTVLQYKLIANASRLSTALGSQCDKTQPGGPVSRQEDCTTTKCNAILQKSRTVTSDVPTEMLRITAVNWHQLTNTMRKQYSSLSSCEAWRR